MDNSEILDLLPPDECWNIPQMPESCNLVWEIFYLKLFMPGPQLLDPEEGT